MWVRVQHFLELIRFSHTIFALPFAMLSAVIAWAQADSLFRLRDLVGIVICMVTARSAAMAFNRLVDRDIDKENPGNGAFELDWNDKFLSNLIRAGYQGKTDQDIVDNWFKAVCRNVIQENFEQEQADPEIRASNRRDLGDGRTEVS